MALVIENGSIVAGANSYVTVAEYTAWADARFGSRSTQPNCDEDVEALILRAMDYFESQVFQGMKTEDTQELQWPRSWVVIDRYSVDANTIPAEVKKSIYELAYAEETGNSELSTVDREVKMEKIGPITVEYTDSAPSTNFNRAVPMAMKKLLKTGGLGGLVVSRA